MQVGKTANTILTFLTRLNVLFHIVMISLYLTMLIYALLTGSLIHFIICIGILAAYGVTILIWERYLFHS